MRGHVKGPLPIQKGPGRCASVSPCDPLAHKTSRQKPTKGGGQYAPAQRRSPWPSLGRGAGEIPYTHFGVITYSGFLEKVWPQNEKGKRKTRQKKHTKTLAASRPKKKASEGPRRIPKTPGAQNGTPAKTPRSGTHGQNGRNRQKRRDTKKKENQKTSACAGVSCYYLNFIS